MNKLGNQYKAPKSVVESELVRVVGQEKREPNRKAPMLGTGEFIYHCVEVVEGKTHGAPFAVGSDELATWKQVE